MPFTVEFFCIALSVSFHAAASMMALAFNVARADGVEFRSVVTAARQSLAHPAWV